MDRDREFYRIEEAASQLGVGRTFLWGLIAKGEIKTVKLGRATRIPAIGAPAVRRQAHGDGTVGGQDPTGARA